jgi:hypothetical protein
MRKSQFEWEYNRLTLKEPIFNSTKTVRLIVVPNDLQRHIFAAFHTNPLGGHFSIITPSTGFACASIGQACTNKLSDGYNAAQRVSCATADQEYHLSCYIHSPSPNRCNAYTLMRGFRAKQPPS